MVKTYEIKENPFSSRKVGCSDDFQKVLEIAINNVLSEKKNKRILQESPMKMQNGYFRHISNRKNFFTKIRLCHVLDIPDAHICAKNQRDL